MTCELITGSAGTEHVSSADAGSMYASVFGTGRYVVNQGDNLAATVESANSIRIGTGAGFIDGRYFRVSSSETVSIDSGSQGVNRIDLIGVKYLYNSGTGLESCALSVVKGTPTSGEPTTPTYTDGNILEGASEAFYPLYSVTINGITPSEPVSLFHMMANTVNCPFPIGSVLQMTSATNPNDIYPGTTWQKIQGAFLLGSSSGHSLGTTGGAETVTLTSENMPAHTHTYAKANSNTNSHTLTVNQIPSHSHGIKSNLGSILASFGVDASWTNSSSGAKLFTDSDSTSHRMSYVNATQATGGGGGHSHGINTTSTNSGSAGSGTAVNTMPPYKVVNMWERVA